MLLLGAPDPWALQEAILKEAVKVIQRDEMQDEPQPGSFASDDRSVSSMTIER